MKFFTREWHGGDLPEDQVSNIVLRYAAHIDALSPMLAATVRTLAQGVNVHDGRIMSVTFDQAHQKLELALRCGDLQVGYFDVLLVYAHININGCSLSDLKTIAEDPKAEVLYDEVDRSEIGPWVHRILFWPYREIQIEFGELDLHLESKPDRKFSRRSPVYLERTVKTES
jgi:hypothetical protein